MMVYRKKNDRCHISFQIAALQYLYQCLYYLYTKCMAYHMISQSVEVASYGVGEIIW